MIPLAIPNLAGNEAAYLQECINSGFVSSAGPFVPQFERMVAQAAGTADAVALASGTCALHLALQSVGVTPGDLVILPAFTFIASANAIAHCGAEPWLLDIEADTWTLDPQQLAQALKQCHVHEGALIHPCGKRVAAIMPVYTLGIPASMDAINRIAKTFNLPVVADAAAALGATYQQKALGGLATLTVFSFNGNKTFTCGGGGAIAGDDATALQRIRHLSTQARVGEDYEHDAVGYNYRMTNVEAAIGCAQLENLALFLGNKRRIDAVYREAFSEIPGIGCFPLRQDRESACWFAGITVEQATFADIVDLCRQLKAQGIAARTFWKPVHLQQPYRDVLKMSLTVTDRLWSTVLTLPCSSQLSAADQAKVITTVKSVLGVA